MTVHVGLTHLFTAFPRPPRKAVANSEDMRMGLEQDLSILLRIAAAMVFGGLIGIEREMGKHAAGLRTHMLIAGAAALIVGLGDSIAEHFQQERYRDLLQVDPVRLIEAVVACVGFVAAGTILRGSRDDQVSGLTTAS